MARSILYTKNDLSIVLVDLPASIEEAQGFEEGKRLLSCEPLMEPFQTNEPMSAKASKTVQDQSGDHEYHDDVADLIDQALHHLKASGAERQSYCLPRQEDPIGNTGEKRKHVDSDENANDVLASFPPINEHSEPSFNDFFHNDTASPYYMKIRDTNTTDEIDVLIPPFSAFLHSKCQSTDLLRASAKKYSPGPSPQIGRFDLIVLDPPWPNRSAKRKKSYQQSYNMPAVKKLCHNLQLDIHITPNGIIAIWVTNRQAIRNVVLGEGGLFESWGVQLVEEWIWIKITESGEPMLPIRGQWRKPYEILLIGKTPSERYSIQPPVLQPSHSVKKRVIAAVPDMHSRKPCLKAVFEKTVLEQNYAGYKALEIFARHLVRGWMSWGDEVWKFNDASQWYNLQTKTNEAKAQALPGEARSATLCMR